MATFQTVLSDPLVRDVALGVRFVDGQTGAFVWDGLAVALVARGGEGQARPGVSGPTGIFSFHDLAGLKGLELPGSDVAVPADESLSFALRVLDPRRRYLPLAYRVDLPRPADADGRRQTLLSVPIHASPAYAPPPGWAAVRGRLAAWLETDGERDPADVPAAFGVVTVARDDAVVGRGVADRRGEFAVFFPFPGVLEDAPAPSAGGLEGVEWDVQVTVRYDAGLAVVPGADDPELQVPDLLDIAAQTGRQVLTRWPDDGTPPTRENALGATLSFGRDTTIETGERTALWVDVLTPST